MLRTTLLALGLGGALLIGFAHGAALILLDWRLERWHFNRRDRSRLYPKGWQHP